MLDMRYLGSAFYRNRRAWLCRQRRMAPTRKPPMPSADTLDSSIARVEQNTHVEAIEAFYTEGATLQGRVSAAPTSPSA